MQDMRLYEGTLQEFRDDVISNRIADILAGKFREYYKKNVSRSEKNSWNNSLNFLKNAVDISNLEDNMIIIEYGLPYSSRRIDVLLFGKDMQNKDNVVLIELKQWSNENVEDSIEDGNIIVNYGRNKITVPHPSIQVEGYHFYLKDFISAFEEEPVLGLNSLVYCHNYSYSYGKEGVLFLPKFKKYLEKYPIYAKEDIIKLGDYLIDRLGKGGGIEVFNRFVYSVFRPSKKLMEHTREMINNQRIFNLIDDQIVAYNAIMHRAKQLSKSNEKAVVIVKGGPGTGKSVIALELMGELLRQGKKVFHATGSSAFTNTLRKILGTRSSRLFKFFNSFTNYGENEVDVLICDEAHRIRETSTSRYTPRYLRTNTPQIEELIRVAKLSVFFIDERQVVRPTEIGNIRLIKDTARKLGLKEDNISEFELVTQFRCSGSDTFLRWVENILGIEKNEYEFLTKRESMEFKIMEDPLELKRIIDGKNREHKNCARITAGFCWPWSDPLPDGTLVKDVKVGNLEMPWERKNQFWKWATDDSGMEQVGTVYTAQGFEFDYIGVIFGDDLVWDKDSQKWVGKPENSYDTVTKRNNEKFVEHLKNVYRVLLTRAHKGVYIYFINKDTEDYFRSKIKR
ncbi:MAG: peptidase S24 [Thermotogae bacterium]|nr:MAG: peptidase S24 [Thermotogota bacterium]